MKLKISVGEETVMINVEYSNTDAKIIKNRIENRIYVADCRNGIGKYLTSAFEDYEVDIKISPKYNVPITYIMKSKESML